MLLLTHAISLEAVHTTCGENTPHFPPLSGQHDEYHPLPQRKTGQISHPTCPKHSAPQSKKDTQRNTSSCDQTAALHHEQWGKLCSSQT